MDSKKHVYADVGRIHNLVNADLRNRLSILLIFFFALLVTSLPILAQSVADEVELGEPLRFSERVEVESVGPTTADRAGGLTVNPMNRQASLDFYNNYYLQSEDVAIGWTGDQASCNAGTTSQAFRDAVALRINYYRAMAGGPAGVTLNETYNSKAQQAALMMSANGSLDHTPPTDWSCYTKEGAEAAGSSNLSLGNSGAAAVRSQMRDGGANNYFAGHRRWILYPRTEQMGSGDVPSVNEYRASNSLWVFDTFSGPRPDSREEFVAWPPPGYVPYQVVYPRWSFSYDGADFSNATVTMTSEGSNVSLEQEELRDGFGENTLVWIPMGLNSRDPWPRPEADTLYTVQISNVRINEAARTFEYNVTVFDPSAAIPTPANPTATPTATNTPTRTPTPTITNTPDPNASPTPTPRGARLYLPLLMRPSPAPTATPTPSSTGNCTPDSAGDSDNINDALTICSGQTVSGQVSSNDKNDVYKIWAEANQGVSISLNGSGGNADLYLYSPDSTDVNSDPVVTGSTGSGNNELIQGTFLNSGFWYIDVFSREGTTNYNLTVTFLNASRSKTKVFETGSGQVRTRHQIQD
ncbi:MAG: CAP domain-containing protein [Ardenticatenaceae bacterium]